MSGSTKLKTKNKDEKKKSKMLTQKLIELENQLILRMPEPYATSLRDTLQNGGLKDRLKIEFADDLRHATIKFDDIIFKGKLFDLPTVVESWKTFDKKSLWKTGNMSQILICRHPDDPVSSSSEEENMVTDYFKRHQQAAKKYKYPHGLTPPLKNVRKRRFRKTAKQKYVDAPEIEKEVKRLIRADVSAVDVKFEVINEELEKQKIEDQEEEIDVGGPTLISFNENSNMSSILSSDNEAGPHEEEILPDISSSEDEGESHKSNKNPSSKEKINLEREYEKQLIEIQNKKLEQELRVKEAANPFLKQRFQSVLDQLIKEEESVYEKLSVVKS